MTRPALAAQREHFELAVEADTAAAPGIAGRRRRSGSAVGKLATPANPASATRSTSSAQVEPGIEARGRRRRPARSPAAGSRTRAKLMTNSLLSRNGSIAAIEGSPMQRMPPGAEREQKVRSAAHGRLRRHSGADRRADEEGRSVESALRPAASRWLTSARGFLRPMLGARRSSEGADVVLDLDRSCPLRVSFRSRRRSARRRASSPSTWVSISGPPSSQTAELLDQPVVQPFRLGDELDLLALALAAALARRDRRG